MSKPKQNRADRFKRYAAQRSYEYDRMDKDGNDTGLTVEDWKKQVESGIKQLSDNKNVASIAYIYHDKDVAVDKDKHFIIDPETNKYKLKPLHVHFVVEYKSAASASAIVDALNISRKANCQGVKHFTHAMRYLTHVTEQAIDDGKHIYDESEVTLVGDWADKPNLAVDPKLSTECNYHWLKLGKTSKQNERQALKEHNDLVDKIIKDYELKLAKGEITIQDLTMRIAHESCDDDVELALEVMSQGSGRFDRAFAAAQEHQATVVKKGQDRDLQTIYVGGAGGTGKSGLASRLGIALDPAHDAPHKVSIQASAKVTFDPVGNYKGEYVTIADDLSPAAIGNAQAFFQFTDPHQLADVGSRNVDKSWLAHVFIISNALSWPDWLEQQMLFSQGGTRYAMPNDKRNYDDDRLTVVNKHLPMVIDWNNMDTKRDRWQYQRRIGSFIQVESLREPNHSLATVWVLDRQHHFYVLAGKYQCNDVTSLEAKDGWAASIINGIAKTKKAIEDGKIDDRPVRVEFDSQTGNKNLKVKMNDRVEDYLPKMVEQKFKSNQKDLDDRKQNDPLVSKYDYQSLDLKNSHVKATLKREATAFLNGLDVREFKITYTKSKKVSWGNPD